MEILSLLHNQRIIQMILFTGKSSHRLPVLLSHLTPGRSIPRKLWHAAILLVITALTGATTNDAGSAQFQENTELGISYNSFNVGAGVLFIGIGYWTLLISPAVWLYGRRISYLVCLMLGVLGGIWFAVGRTTNDAIFNQLFVGASESCSEANVQLSLMDIFFQHQRGAVSCSPVSWYEMIADFVA